MGKLTKKLSDGKPVKVYNVRPSTAVKRLRLSRLQPMTEETSESTTKRMRGLLKYSSLMFNVRKYLKWEHVTEYCENSSIHGFSYFTNRDIHRVERIWWILSVTLSLIGCCLLIKDQYDKWDQSPVIVTFSEKMISINTIPFPAVTICPEIKSKKEIFNFTKAVMDKVKLRDPPLYGLSEDELELLIVNLQICDQYATGDLLNFFDKKIANDTVFDLIKMMAPGMEESLFGCMFRTSHYSCDDLFQEIITDDGLCTHKKPPIKH